MTIPCWKTPEGVWEPIRDDPLIISKDGKVQASLSTIMSTSWTWEERHAFGVYEMKSAPDAPEGYRAISEFFDFDPADNRVNRGFVLERIESKDVTTGRPQTANRRGRRGTV